MNQSLQRSFNQSLEALERGESLEQILANHPGHADELRPLLLVALRAMESAKAQPNRGAQLRSRTDMISRANELSTNSATKNWFSQLQWGLAAALIILVILVTGSFGLVAASAQALPGDELYPVKRAAERIQLSFTPGITNRLNLTIHQETQRLHEVQRLLALGRVVEVEFEARLDSRADALWQFGNVPVLVTNETVVPSGLRVGDVIQVRGRTTTQGWVRALRFSAASLTFDGRIETAKSNQWIIDGRAVTILPSSRLEQGLQPGDLVRVRARTEGEILVAEQIEAIEPKATPVPTIIPSSPEPSPTRAATEDVDEVDDLEQFDLTGQLETKDGSRWQIDGRWVHLDEETDLEGEFQVGATVRAKGEILSNGRYRAEEIRQLDDEDDNEESTAEADEDDEQADDPTASPTEASSDEEDDDDGSDSDDDGEDGSDSNDNSDDTVEVDITGVVQSIDSNQWVVAGQTLIITGETRIDDGISVGDEVDVDADRVPNGTLYAEKIERTD